jgi:hypothetical protein
MGAIDFIIQLPPALAGGILKICINLLALAKLFVSSLGLRESLPKPDKLYRRI